MINPSCSRQASSRIRACIVTYSELSVAPKSVESMKMDASLTQHLSRPFCSSEWFRPLIRIQRHTNLKILATFLYDIVQH